MPCDPDCALPDWPHEGACRPRQPLRPGDRVTWNDTGKELFGDTGSEGLLVEVTENPPGQHGRAGHVLWASGQDTWASLSCLRLADRPSAPPAQIAEIDDLVRRDRLGEVEYTEVEGDRERMATWRWMVLWQQERDRIARVLAIDPEDHATKSRDYGRGFADAIRQVRAALGPDASEPTSPAQGVS